ncbi:MAG: reverse gyrase [Candidatus Aenigmatarchaeota archaeon]
MIKAVYKQSCINCEGEIEAERLYYGLPCKKCLPNIDLNFIEKLKRKRKNWYKEIYKLLRKNFSIKNYTFYYKILSKTSQFEKFFKKAVNSKPWNAQLMWFKRAIQKKSFAILAPTGTGKTTFLIILSLFLAREKSKIYFILPTSLLANQVYQKFLNFKEKLNLNVRIACYNSLLKQKEKQEQMNKIISKDFDVLITTSMFLSKKFEIIKDNKFDLIIVDDVDSFLKASKNVDKVLMLLGFNQEIISKALENVELRRSLIFEKDENKRKEIEKKIEENQKIIEREKKFAKTLIVSGASARARTKRVMLFKELLDFTIGTRIEGIRNIEDLYEKVEKIEEKVLEYVRKFGKGGLIFVPMDKGSEYAEYLEKYLNENGINAKAYLKPKISIINDFIEGKLDVLIGVASYRSPLARGIDLPEVIRYAIFAGVPKFKIKIELSEFRPIKLAMLLSHLREYFEKEVLDEVDVLINKLKKIALTEENSKAVIEAIQKNEKLEGFLGYCQEIFVKVLELLKNQLSKKEIIEKLKQSKKLVFGEELDKFYFVIPDVQAYIQASGRTSRLYAGGISKGLSLILIDEEKAFNGLIDKIRWFIEDLKFKGVKEVDIEKILKEIDEDRRKIKLIKEGKFEAKQKELIKIALMIVESPTKAKTIARFFGIPARREIGKISVYECSTGKHLLLITASIGHIFDLVTKEGYHGILANSEIIPIYSTIKRCPKCDEQFSDLIDFCPYDNEKLEDKKEILDALRSLAIEVDEIYLATDPDTEGEKIAFDLALYLKPLNRNIKRLEFHEITLRAILNALENPRDINENLVKAQIVRRVEDRLFGFELSQKVQQEFKRKTLSAGRVQTPVLGWIIDRTEESKKSIKTFIKVKTEKFSVVFESDAKYAEEKEKILESISSNPVVFVKKVEEKEETLNPLPPYTTDSLLRDASIILKFDVSKTMRIAQELFESGLITYHRTPSTSVSYVGISIAKEVIKENFGEEYFVARSWQQEGAHECIRPTKPISAERLIELLRLGLLQLPIRITKDHLALYNLIFNRFIASQMKSVKVIKTIYEFKLADLTKTKEFITKILEEGFNKLIPIKVFEIGEGKYEIKEFNPERDLVTRPSILLYTEGEVVNLMKERKIGRPSTYATIISKLLERKYVIKTKNNKLVNSKLGKNVFEFLKSKFGKYVSEETTRELEKIMDEIEEGKADYQQILKEIYLEALYIKNTN